ncbi:hypothetical protein GCM10011360_05960 [Primorskyibacter flagellatus]|uniref:Uncharacterized protein n=1 Tax=Primorskyibacter flagellatus TaxID=1387277 RepID=A0A917ECT5_9RHOB|nr:phage holin family protein [Primorskyibacter flagellatus]GGE20041.1 hypothetical protein GCM10011360_05960 [Primorskyibacter flagellatus]
MLHSLKLSLRRAGFGLGGALLMVVGVGFLTAAAWLILSEARGAQFAALVIGFGYVGAGAVVMAVGTRRVPHAPAPGITASGLSAAFAQGFGAGVATRSSMRGNR